MFFLPCKAHLDEAGFNIMSTLPKIVWQGLVDVDNVNRAVELLRDINWLYKNVNEDSVDEAAKKAVKVVSGATSPMLERASEDDVRGLQAYTTRKMDQYS